MQCKRGAGTRSGLHQWDVHGMFIISRLCFPKWRHWCPGLAWVSQWSVVVAVWSDDLKEVAAAGKRRGGPTG